MAIDLAQGGIPQAVAQAQATTDQGTAADTASGGVASARHYDGYAWLVAWGVLIAILTLANRTRVGHAAIYYGLILLLFFVIVSNYRFITTALAPFQSLP